MDNWLAFAGLAETDINVIQPEVREKLDIAFDALFNDVNDRKTELESLRQELEITKENHLNQIKQLEDSCTVLTEKSSDFEKLLSETDIKFREAYAEKMKIQDKLDELHTTNNELSFALRNSENEKDILSDQLKHKIQTIEELSTEISDLKAQAESARKLKVDSLIRMEEIESRESAVKAQELRRSEELSSMQRNIEWLEERLRQTTDQLATVRRDASQKVHCLESELELRNTELDNSRKNTENLTECVAKLTKANEDYIDKLKQVADEQIRLEQLYGNELDAQKQLVALYKAQLSDAEKKVTELTEVTSSMQSMLKSAYESITRLESDKSFLQQQYHDERTSLETKLQELTDELDRSRRLLEKFRVDGLSEDELRQLNPSVAATLSALKRGHSLTQLYTDYIQVVEDRDQLRLDKHRLTEYVKQLVEEVKEKAPVFKEQQDNYKRTKSQLQETSVALQSTNDKLKEAESRRQEMQRRAGYYQRETARWKQTCADLSKQVQVLLREVEVARGVVVEQPEMDSPVSTNSTGSALNSRHIQQLPDSSTADVKTLLEDINSSAATVIDEHLVTWRNLQELQGQNQRLLCVSRDLASQLELKETEEAETSKRVSELSIRLETLTGELDVVRIAAREARAEVDVVTRQRDTYRSLLEQHDIEVQQENSRAESMEANIEATGSTATEHALSQKENVTPGIVEKLENTLSALETEFRRYREDKTESDKIYSTTIEQLRKEASEARLLNQKLASQLDFTHEKLRMMETNVSGYKQEITVLREMNARYSTSAAASEADLARLREDLLRTSDRLLEVEVDARHAARQLDVARANEARWRQEIEALRRQDQMHTQLMHQLQAIQGNLEQRDLAEKTSSERRMSQLEKDLSESQSAFAEANAAFKMKLETLEHELEVSRQNVTTREAEITRLQSEISKLESDAKAGRSQKARMSGLINEDGQSSDEAERQAELTSDQTELKSEIDALRLRLESARQHANQMRELAEETEQRLTALTDENSQLEERLRSELKETKQRCEFLESQLDLEKKERQNLVNENIRITEEAHQMNAELRRELANLQSELESMKHRCESALALEAGAKAAIEEHGRLSQEARAKYERELAMHAEDVEALVEARRQASDAQSKVSDLEKKVADLEGRVETVSKDMTAASTTWDEEREQLKQNLADSEKENGLMQDQLLKLTQQIVALRRLMEKPGVDDEPSCSTEATEPPLSDFKTSEDLLQLVGYLRRQKSIAEATCDASSAEISRLLLRVSSLESQNAVLVENLEKERKANELAIETSQRHSQLMERVEQLNLLTESNRLLRRERETLQTNLVTAEQQVRDLEALVGPLRERNDEFRGQLDSMLSERRSLEEERDRWKERCNRLVETAQRMDPEQYRLACNERDELQRKLRRSEEELQQQVTKFNDLRSEMESVSQRLGTELREALASKAQVEALCDQHRTACESLRRDLENKETTVAKLRELGRKYRQESETLRRQLSVNRSDEAELRSMNESLTEARADLVTLRSDLAAARTDSTRLSTAIDEAFRVLEGYKSHSLLGPLLGNVPSSSEPPADQPLANCLNQTLESVSTEFNRLHQQAVDQRERLLRTQLIESQLTKSQRECNELRARVAEYQSAMMSQAASLQTPEVEPSDAPHTGSSHFVRQPTSATPNQPGPEPGNVVELPVHHISPFPESSSSLSQPPSAWMMRAAATVQPVHPTPALTPPNSAKQTAEIRPITSNVATVMPTPAAQIVQTTTFSFATESVLTPSLGMTTTSTNTSAEVISIVVPSVSSVSHATDLTVPRAESTAASVFRPTSRRVTAMGQPQLGTDHQFPLSCSLQSGLPRSPITVPVTTVASVAGKRRHEDAVGLADSPSTTLAAEEVTSSSSSVGSSSNVESVAHAQHAPDPKRLRQQDFFSREPGTLEPSTSVTFEPQQEPAADEVTDESIMDQPHQAVDYTQLSTPCLNTSGLTGLHPIEESAFHSETPNEMMESEQPGLLRLMDNPSIFETRPTEELVLHSSGELLEHEPPHDPVVFQTDHAQSESVPHEDERSRASMTSESDTGLMSNQESRDDLHTLDTSMREEVDVEADLAEEEQEEEEEEEPEEIEGEQDDNDFYADAGDDEGFEKVESESVDNSPESSLGYYVPGEDVIELSSGSGAESDAQDDDNDNDDDDGNESAAGDDHDADEENHSENQKSETEDNSNEHFPRSDSVGSASAHDTLEQEEETAAVSSPKDPHNVEEEEEASGSTPATTGESVTTATGFPLFGSPAFSSRPVGGLFSGIQTGSSVGLFGTPPSFSSSFPAVLQEKVTDASSTSVPGLFRSSVLTAAASSASHPSPQVKSSAPSTTPLFATTPAENKTPSTTEAVPTKPRIQPIVWDQTSPSSVAQTSTAEPVTDRMVGATRRKKWGGPAQSRFPIHPGVLGNPEAPAPSRGGASGLGAMRPGGRRL